MNLPAWFEIQGFTNLDQVAEAMILLREEIKKRELEIKKLQAIIRDKDGFL